MQKYQQGQIFLIVVLVMVTALTVGLSVAVRSITNTRMSQESSNSERAFSAAEAGIERSLTSKSAVTGAFPNNVTYTTTVLTVAGVGFPLNNDSPVFKDDPVDLLLSTYPDYTNPWSGDLTIYWGQATDICSPFEANNTMAALEIIVFRGTKANPQTTRAAVDPCQGRTLYSSFEYIVPGGGTINGKTYRYRKTITINSGLFIRIIPLYAPASIAVQGCNGGGGNCNGLPAQGTVIQSVGTAGGTQRKIETYRHYPKLPGEILQYSLFVPK